MRRYHEGLSVHGALAAVGLRPHGIPRAERPLPGFLLLQNAHRITADLGQMIGQATAILAAQPRPERVRRSWRVERLRALAA